MGVCQEQEKELKRHLTEMEKMGKKKVDKVRKRDLEMKKKKRTDLKKH
jgi:hypothetical protein